MNDTISRRAAIDALDEVSKHYTEKGRGWHPHVDLMIYAIKELPSAQQWIPVTERLPEKNGEYLVTEIDCITSERLTDIAYYDDFICTNNGFHKANDIAAWMPLPKPWKGDKDETD